MGLKYKEQLWAVVERVRVDDFKCMQTEQRGKDEIQDKDSGEIRRYNGQEEKCKAAKAAEGSMIRDQKRIATEGKQVNVTEDAKVSTAFTNRVDDGDFAGGSASQQIRRVLVAATEW